MSSYPALKPGSPLLFTWTIPGAGRRLTLRRGSVGFILIYIASWFNDMIERLDGPGNDPVDEGGHNYRLRTDSDTDLSEHAKGTAEDLNWNRHPYGVAIIRTFTARQIKLIRRRMGWINRIGFAKVLIWGGDWPSHPGSTAKTDGMHFEITGTIAQAERVAKILARTKRGKRILAANPGQRDVIYS